MLLYLPERLYKILEKDEKYASMVKEVTSDIFGYDGEIDFIKTLFRYENADEKIRKLQDYIRSVSPQEYQMELELSLNDDLEKFEKDFDSMDIESKLYWLCEVNAGDMTHSKEFILRNSKFIRLYRNHVLPKKDQYSSFFHCMYYSKMIYNKIYDLFGSEQNYSLLTELYEYESQIFNEVINYSDLESFKQMMYSKREQMYVYFYAVLGQMCDEQDLIIDFIRNCINNEKFKYNKFTYFRFMFNNLCFNRYIDAIDLRNSKSCLDKMIEMIKFVFNNKEYAMKSLNHYNNAFIDEFLAHSKFVIDFIREYLPNAYKKLKFDTLNLTELERRFYNDELSNEELTTYQRYLKTDNFYSNKWSQLSAPVFEMLDKLYS
jgi:hypothetical protein